MPKHIISQYSAAWLSDICELLPGLIHFALVWHEWCILDKNVYMKKNYDRTVSRLHVMKTFSPKCNKYFW